MSKPVLMCVDDEKMILLSLKDQLREHFSSDFQIEMIESGEDALELAKDLLSASVEIPVIICDQIMPGLKGNELLRQLHALSPKTFNILLTGQADAGAVGDAVNFANLYRYIPKPWEETDLVLTIKEAVRSFYQDKRLEEQNRTLKEMNENLEALVHERTAEVMKQNEEIQSQMRSIEYQRKELQVRNEFIRNVFGRYVSDEVMDTILKDPEGLQIGGAKRDISVLMSDLRGFTVITENLPAEAVVRILNRYFERMVEIIAEFSGIVIEFLGDGIMVIFGAPKRLANHAEHAIACALSMQVAMEELNAMHTAEGMPGLEMGIGISSGEVVVGNIGSERRTKYGVIGNAANLAARIEALSTGQQVLISSDTLDRCHATVEIVREFEVSVKGVDHPLRICEVSAIHDSFQVRFTPTWAALREVHKDATVEISILDGKSVSNTVLRKPLRAVSRQQALLADNGELQLRADVRLLALHVDGTRVPMEIYGKVTSVDSDAVTLRFTSILLGETEAYLSGLLDLPPEKHE
ncbi:MAG: adenylate/guanylate cyclase domain-containing protein [Bacteroidota bacterium]|nr:adenylate/guanylate cyclase domain-containing protein [Bacteroidota bacterium]